MATPAAVAYVRTCVEVDATTHECTAEAWMPPPYAIPRFSAAEGVIGTGFLLLCWTIGHLGKTSRKAMED